MARTKVVYKLDKSWQLFKECIRNKVDGNDTKLILIVRRQLHVQLSTCSLYRFRHLRLSNGLENFNVGIRILRQRTEFIQFAVTIVTYLTKHSSE